MIPYKLFIQIRSIFIQIEKKQWTLTEVLRVEGKLSHQFSDD